METNIEIQEKKNSLLTVIIDSKEFLYDMKNDQWFGFYGLNPQFSEEILMKIKSKIREIKKKKGVLK